jgi:hypothetical protein
MTKLKEEDYTFESSFDGTGPLYALAVYPKNAGNSPIMVLMCDCSGTRDRVRSSAVHMAGHDYFCICVEIRGHGDSAGKQDDNGLEIMDIYDGMQAAGRRYGELVDMSNISIAGYSGGGGNVYFAVLKFPFLFRGAITFFGISDYGMWGRLYQRCRPYIEANVGGSLEEVPQKYMVRNAALAAGNLRGTRFHIAYDQEETICPKIMNTVFFNAAKERGYENIFVHESRKEDKDRWLHKKRQVDGHLCPMEDVFMHDLASSSPGALVMPMAGALTVLGFIVTPKFKCVLRKGHDAVATVEYDFGQTEAWMDIVPVTATQDCVGELTLAADLFAQSRQVIINGRKTATTTPGAETPIAIRGRSTLLLKPDK